jgi:putative CocE/NonD family hydrolase
VQPQLAAGARSRLCHRHRRWPRDSCRIVSHESGHGAQDGSEHDLHRRDDAAGLCLWQPDGQRIAEECQPLPTGVGPQDQRPAEARGDVLVFSSPAFAQNTEVTGPISLDLYVSSSAVDTDFTGKVVDVWPNGFAQNLTEGILRLRYRNSQEKPELGNPGEIYHISVDLWATSNVFLPGHKLRLEVSSSNFPRFDRNLNTGEDQARGTHMIKATNVIYHDKSRPSSLVLPIVP